MNATTSTTATTDADPDDVFGLLTDIDRLAEWNHIITRVLHRPTDLAPGAEWVVEMYAMGLVQLQPDVVPPARRSRPGTTACLLRRVP